MKSSLSDTLSLKLAREFSPDAFAFDDISLTPRQHSTLPHRMDADPSLHHAPLSLQIPIVAAPMPDVCGQEMCHALDQEGGLGLLHRFQPVAMQVSAYQAVPACGAAIGITGDFQERFSSLYAAGCRIFCLDTANGAHTQVASAIKWINGQASDSFLIAGNVASKEAFAWLEDHGAHAIRVGIAGGSVCETKTETGVYVPTPYAVYEAACIRQHALIIGDSGIRTPADMCKLLALGADLTMVGSVLAGTRESPGEVIVVDGKKYKMMRGAASFSVQHDVLKGEPTYVEGSETLVSYKGSVRDVLHRFRAGLRSSMSYMDARTLAEYRHNAHFVRLSRQS